MQSLPVLPPSAQREPLDPRRRAEPTLNAVGSQRPQEPAPSTHALELLAVALSHEKFADAATAFATELARRFHCTQVAIGFLRKRYVQVAAVSHNTDFSERQSLLNHIANAMDECLDQGATIVFPPPPGAKPTITQFHGELSRHRSNAAICSIPMARAGAVRGVIAFERASEQPFTAHSVDLLEQIAALLGPLLDIQRERERPLRAVLAERSRAALRRLIGGSYLTAKLTCAGLALALAAAAWVKVEYRVAAPARLEGSVQRAVVAPTDAFLKQVQVRPGAVVKQGQPLALLEQDAFDLERRKLESEIAQHESAYRDAIAKHDRSGVVGAQARIEETRAQLALINDKLGRTHILAPFDGVIIKGDLSQMLGAPIKQGDTLFTIAPQDDYRVMLEVDERDVGHVAQGSAGDLALRALPGELLALRVQRVTPVANAADGRNYFEVEAQLDGARSGAPAALRPGLKGVAKINAGQRSLLWAWSHRTVDALRLMTWSWTR